MENNKPSFTSIDEYIAAYPPHIQAILQQIRATIHAAAPHATEKISYQMPTFYLNGNLVHFGVHKNHIGFYPTPSGIEEFKDDLAVYGSGKGSARFPLDQPIPYDLITRIVQFRVQENMRKAQKKKK